MKIKIYTLLLSAFFIGLFACQNGQENNSDNLTDKAKQSYLEKGKSIAAKSFFTLSSALQKAMQEGGIPNAIQYCNLNAIPIIDSLSKAEDALIRRTSLKVRNPHDEPTVDELKILRQYQTADEGGKEIQAIVEQLEDNRIAFYAPIRVNELCLKCHGELGASLSEESNAIIQQYYPKDKAIGYKAGELRGMWSIQFKTE